ncbi:MAG: YigZ family protein [Gammaproteobacteria bacterium]
MNAFNIPVGPQQTTLEIKRSQFITCIDHTKGVEAAKSFIAEVQSRFPDANHHCYAYVAGAPDDIYQVDKGDDGEPRGTAGKPMLNVLQHSGVGEITAVVVRYFGGVKLGAGGLVRAYTQSVSTAMSELDLVSFVRKTQLTVTLPYTLLGQLEHWLTSTDIDTLDKQFDESVHLVLDVPETDIDSVKVMLGEIGQGSISWIPPDA